MTTTNKLLTMPIVIKLRRDMHKPVYVMAPLWKKRVLKTQAWFISKNRIMER